MSSNSSPVKAARPLLAVSPALKRRREIEARDSSRAAMNEKTLTIGDAVSVAMSITALMLCLFIDVMVQDLRRGHTHSTAFSFALILSIIVLCALVIAAPITHVLAVSKYESFVYFQPFRGGAKFVMITMLAWLFYGVAIVLGFVFVKLVANQQTPAYGILSAAGTCGFGAQVLVFFSLRYFQDTTKTTASVAHCAWQWNTTACFAMVVLTIIPATYFVLIHSLAGVCGAEGMDCQALQTLSSWQQFAVIFAPYSKPTLWTYVVAIVAMFAAAPITHGIAGADLNSTATAAVGDATDDDEGDIDMVHAQATGAYKFFQPFQGGRRYVLLQMFGWTFYTFGVISALALFYVALVRNPTAEFSLTLATYGGISFLIAQVLVLVSLPYFEAQKAEEQVRLRDHEALAKEAKWGRYMDGDWVASFLALGMMMSVPFIVLYFWMSCESFQCALSGPLLAAWDLDKNYVPMHTANSGTWAYVQALVVKYAPVPTLAGLRVMLTWTAFQLAVYLYLPGPIDYGQLTPGDNRLKYKVNGFNAWIFTHVCFVLGVYFGLFEATVVYDHWGSLFVWANVFGLSLTVFAYVKARVAPTHPEDAKLSGSFFYDMFMGVELNPRIGDLDFKLFFNGRPGIVGWSIINLSFAAAQYRQFGYVTNTMVAVNILHNVYILDFFYNEGWYLRTIDIAHDHFGFYLAWGDTVWLPWMYTLQAQYLARHAVQMSVLQILFIYALGFGGYFIFRSVNHQKDSFRAKKGDCIIWGEKATYIECTFATRGGTRTSLLLTSGWWGLSRHFNYVGDLMMSLSFCLCCGTEHLLPYFYIVYMTILLVHRVYRDDTRCRGKYGKYWEQYCERVPWKILPYVF